MSWPLLFLVAPIAQGLLVPRASQDCCFGLSAIGVVGGKVGQLSDGQTRFGSGDHPDATFCLHNGVITDASGRGCILTPETTQYQCDQGALGTPGFSIRGSSLAFTGSTKFTACPVDAIGQYNIYTFGVSSNCIDITLKIHGNCNFESGSSASITPHVNTTSQQALTPSPPSSVVAPSVSTESASASVCPADLHGAYQAPYSITIAGKGSSNQQKTTTFTPIINSDSDATFGFSIPTSYTGKACSLILTWPLKSQLETSDYTTTGSGDLVFTHAASGSVIGVVHDAAPGHNYVINSQSCQPGVEEVKVSSTGTLDLTYFQDYNPEPIGLWIRACQ